MATYIPDTTERKGSLFLRCDHMNYGRATLNSNWHQAREAEPKEYDLSKDPVRDLCKATYHRIGNITDGTLPQTTYQDFSEQVIKAREQFTEQEATKPMINTETVGDADMDRDTGSPEKGYGAVLPGHHPEWNKVRFDTTHRVDYGAPFPFTRAEEKPQEFPDHSMAYKKCQSQFTDTASHRREGRNTWQDESGIYTNSHLKAECPTFKRFDPILKEYIK